jgi:hypothetical protein
MSEKLEQTRAAGVAAGVAECETAESRPAKKIPCWTCGGDLLLNYATICAAGMTIRTYCARCRKAGSVNMVTER